MDNMSIDDICSNDSQYNIKHFPNEGNDEDNLSLYKFTFHTCYYIDVDSFQKKYHMLSKQISFFSHNVRSLPKKFTDLKSLIDNLNGNKFKFSVIALPEIWSNPTNFDFSIPG